MKLRLLLFLLLVSKISFAQFTYEGTVVDANSNQPIAGANVKIKGSNRGEVTNQNGVFKIEIKEIPATLLISHVGYEAEEKVVRTVPNKKEFIYLMARTNLLNEITVVPEEQVESISNVEKYSILDFEIMEDKIYRLEYHGVFKKQVLSVTDLAGKVKSTTKLGNIKRIEGLHKSCNNLIYVVSSSHAHLVAEKESELSLISKISRDTFNQFVEPCELRKGNTLYYINKKFNGMMSRISSYDLDTDDYRILRTIANETQLDHYKKDVYFIAHSQRISNIFTNSYAENKRIRNIQEDGDFLLTVFYKPEYPVYLSPHGEKVVLLNHIEKKIETYQKDSLESEVAIDYVLMDNWLKAVTVDPITEKAYGLFDYKKGVGLQEIDLTTGATKLVAILDTAIQNYKSVSVFDGVVYYLKAEVGREGIMELLRYGL